MNIRFTNEYSTHRIDEIVDYLNGPRLWIPETDYPDFHLWLERAYKELRNETKRAVIALQNRRIIGATIYQRHKENPELLELKNLTVRPEERGRYIASFLVRNTEIEGQREFGSKAIIVDAKVQNRPIKQLFARHNYAVSEEKDLYGLGTGGDLVFTKSLEQTRLG